MKWKFSVAGIAVATLLVSGCTGTPGPDSGDGEFVTDGTFTMGLYGDLGTLNPFLNVSSTVREFTPIAYDRLLYFDEKGDPNPWLAESWEETLTSVTYTLKEGITCSDGSDFTAATAAANFEFIEDEANGSPLRGALVPVGVTATVDEASRSFTLNFESSSSFLLYQTGTLDMLCQGALDEPTSIDAATNGTGLFALTEALAGDRYVFERRESYNWGFDDTTPGTAGVPKTVTIRMFNNESTLANSLLAGEVNAGRVVGADSDRMVAANLEFTSNPLLAGQFWFNQSAGNATAELAVRQALIRSLDLNDLALVHTGGRGSLATSALSYEPRPCHYTSTGSVPTFDLDAAMALLDTNGWVVGSDGVRAKNGQRLAIGLIYDNSTDAVKAAAELTEVQWSRLGADVTLLGGDDAYVIGTSLGEDRGSWQVTWVPVQVELPVAMTPLISGEAPPNGINLAGVDHPDYLGLVGAAEALTGADSCDSWKAAEESLVKDLYTVPFATQNDTIYFNGATTTVSAATPLGPAIRVTK